MSAESDRARMLLDIASAQLDRESQLLAVVGALADEVHQLWRDLAELHDEHLALSNRIEAATRSAATGGTLLHSVQVRHEEPS